MTTSTEPPYYLLVSHSSLQHSSGLSSNSLAHTSVEYRYADDSPLILLSRHPDEHVLVLNHDPAKGDMPMVQSTSSHMAVTGIKVSVAPGASANEDHSTNDNMYVLEVVSTSDDQYAVPFFANRFDEILVLPLSLSMDSSHVHLQNPQAILSRFKQRSAWFNLIVKSLAL
ncbi:hypothetical protein EV702DRAFT_1055370 [Suillus placidus]|uniref:Uncharacterized protein n=1 Tax=Suillus placidus TaxID=48579 RepID=A0A9P7A774_9AGAM|nr:hypothetical protein EV702DRAFT_1055370 [Suillus placidus]